MKSVLRLLALFSLFACAQASDLSITVGSFVPSAAALKEAQVGTAGATITKGQLLYLDSGTNTFKLADANGTAATAKVVAIAASDAVSGQGLLYLTKDADLTLGATLSMSAPIYCLSATAGGIAPTADITTGWYPCAVLVAKSTTKCIFDPSALRQTSAVTVDVWTPEGGIRLVVVRCPPLRLHLRQRHPAFSVSDLALAA